MNKRIWELDAFRGICILGMVVIHFLYNMTAFYGIFDWSYPAWFTFIKEWGGVLFLALSGICATLGSRSVRRGLIVFGCGLVVSAATVGMYLLHFANRGIIIYFGVLQCLGLCMILWPVFKKLRPMVLLLLAVTFIAGGFLFQGMVSECKWLMPLGIVWSDFVTADYFPLLPNFGYFLAGAVLGRLIYSKKETLLPNVNADSGILKFLQACGRHSLWIYLLHQPVIGIISMLILYLQ